MPGLRWSPPAIGSRCDGCRTCASGGRRRATSRRFARSSTRRPASRCCGNKPSGARSTSTSTSLIPCLVCDRAIGELPLRTAPSGARRTYVRERIHAQDSGSRAATARILSVAQALPPNFVDQDTLLAAFRELWGQKHFNLERLEQLHRAVRVGGRHLALPLERYPELRSFAERNAAWTEAAVDLGAEAVRSALLAADLSPAQVDHLYFVTVTGIATPSIDARLVDRLGLRADVKRVPIFGLGCVAGGGGPLKPHHHLLPGPPGAGPRYSLRGRPHRPPADVACR